jgi:hypothetical protein
MFVFLKVPNSKGEFVMSSPAPDTTQPVASTTAATSTTPDATAVSTTTTAATTTSNPATLKALRGFGKIDINNLANTAHVIAKGVGSNPQYFGKPPVDPAELDASATALSNSVLAAMTGGKAERAVRNRQRKLVIQDLNLLAVYVQNVSNDDPVIFAASGFTAKSTAKSAPQPVATPKFRYLKHGTNSGQIVGTVKGTTGGKSYFFRYAVMNGTTPAWITVPVASLQKPFTISGLTPTMIYGFQVQALGVLGYSDWSAVQSIICI